MKASKDDKRNNLLPIIASYFAELGYRRATTSELANRCDVKEAILYRLWPSKKEMFLDSLDYIADNLVRIWQGLLSTATEEKTALELLISYESEHFAELNNYLVIYSALNEADDPEIKESLQRMYFYIHSFLVEKITLYRVKTGCGEQLSTPMLAWALMGIGTMVTITKHLGMLTEQGRSELLSGAAQALLEIEVSGY